MNAHTLTFVPLSCSQCTTGRYVVPGYVSAAYVCDSCDHEVAPADVDLEPGERLTYGAGIGLGYVLSV